MNGFVGSSHPFLAHMGAEEPTFLHSRAGCAACSTINYYFLLEPPQDNGSEALRATRLYQFPKPPAATEVEEGIETISPTFVEILGQVEEAEQLGLTTLIGIGYRKALEYLIKDHLKNKMPNQAEEIKKCILVTVFRNWSPTRISNPAQSGPPGWLTMRRIMSVSGANVILRT